MTDHEINIAIAEACPTLFQIIGRETHWRICCEGEDSRVRICDDLNAMHEVWKTLSHEQKMGFKTELSVIVCRFDNPVEETYYEGATARQRAEAFLRTLGKWKD